MTLVGQQLGYYQLVRFIGEGGMGEVYLAEDTRIARQVAIKVVRNEHQPYPNTEIVQQAERLFQREMKAISQLDHPHILGFYDFGKQPGPNGSIIYMVMPYRSEGSLADWLVQRGSALLAPPDVEHMIAQAASALQHAHDHEIIHQDVKPSNFLLRANVDKPSSPDLFLVDFGIARVMSAASTTTNSMRGTPAYMPPEQWSSKPVPATDQYALAIMTYQLLTGYLPFQGMAEQIMFQHLTVAPKAPSELNTHLSPAIDAVILRALAKQSDERFPTIKAFAVALQEALTYTDLHTELLLRSEQALQSENRPATLADKHQSTATLLSHAEQGQILHLPEQGTPYYSGGPRGPLVLTLAGDQASSTEAIAVDHASTSNKSNQQAIKLPSSKTMSGNKHWPRRIGVLVGLVLLLTVSGVLAAVFVNNNLAIKHASASATAQALINTNTVNTADTAQAQIITNMDATSRAQAQQTNTTAKAQRMATVLAANADPYEPPVGRLAFVDTLSQGNQRPQYGFSSGNSCQYRPGAYQVRQTQINTFSNCQERITYRNFAFEVKMKINEGNCGGITVRNKGDGQQYLFRVCTNGSYSFLKRTLNAHSGMTVLRTQSTAAIRPGIGQLNVIAIVADGDTFDLYVNHQEIDSLSDSTSNQGTIGLVAYDEWYHTSVLYQDARLWIVPQL